MAVSQLVQSRKRITAQFAPYSFDAPVLRSWSSVPHLSPDLSLSDFARQAWHILEPRSYVHGWHIDAIFEHLEALSCGEIRNLIINMPPRHMKSLAMVFWQAWLWTWKPETRFFGSSYDAALAIRDAVKMRDIIESAWYQERFGRVVQLKADQNQKTRFDNNRTGYRLATSVGGRGLGEGGDIIIADDPHNRKDVHNPDLLAKACDWWDKTISTRGNDPKEVVKVVVMQRLHDSDLTGHLLQAMRDGGEHYEHLCLPARYDQSRLPTSIGWVDPRTEEGELLWPERFDDESIRKLERSLGSEAPGQLQQNPVTEGGNIFKAAFWEDKNRYGPEIHKVISRIISLDTALKDDETNDNTAWTIFDLLSDYRVVVREIDQVRIESTDLPDLIMDLAQKWNYDEKLVRIVIEDKGSGTTATQTLRKSAPAWIANIVYAFMPNGSKQYRAKQAAIWCARDMVLMPSIALGLEWLHGVLDPTDGELMRFPRTQHDDRVDSFSQGILYMEDYLSKGFYARMAQGVAA